MNRRGGHMLTLIIALLAGGCAQVIAYRQPGPLDRGILTVGAERTKVIGTLGAPIGTDNTSDTQLAEVYTYTDGGTRNASASKATRMFLYTAGDLFTIFLDQVIWMPLELAFKGKKYTAHVNYQRGGDQWLVHKFEEVKAGTSEIVRSGSAPPVVASEAGSAHAPTSGQ